MLYLIKVNIILALLCLLFQVVMHRDTFFGVRRAMLWGIYLTAFLLPLCDVQLWMLNDAATMHLASDYATYVLPTLEVTASRLAAFGIQQQEPGCGIWFVGCLAIWGLIYVIPVVWMTLKLLWQFAYIIYLRCTCRPTPLPLPCREGSIILQEKISRLKQTNDADGCSEHITPSLQGSAGGGSVFYYYPRPCSPFSFGPWIFLHHDGMDGQTLREVLIHEQTHVRQWHTADILFSQLVCILFWWNPAAWVMRREVRMNLEFLADKAVADALTPLPYRGGAGGGALKAYQYRLLGFSTQTNVATIANNFNVLPLKHRIRMMNLQRTRRMGMVKYILFVPVAAALLLLSNIDALARTIGDKVQEPLLVVNGKVVNNSGATLSQSDIDHVTVLHEESARSIYGEDGNNGAIVIETKDDGDPIYEKVDKLPQYPGGEQALYVALMKTICYPAAAHDCGVQARVLATFVVETDGSMSDIQIEKMTDPVTGQPLSEVTIVQKRTDQTPEEAAAAEKKAEGLRAIKAETERGIKLLPDRWQPGEQDGKPVRVRFTLPVTFKLQ